MLHIGKHLRSRRISCLRGLQMLGDVLAAIIHWVVFKLTVSVPLLARRGEPMHTSGQHGFSRDDFVLGGDTAHQGLS